MKLPNRRPNITETVMWGTNGRSEKLHVTIGLYLDGTPAEVFAYGPKVGSGHYALLQERCVEASKRLQDGDEPSDFAPYIERNPDGTPQTIWGAVVDCLTAYEAERCLRD